MFICSDEAEARYWNEIRRKEKEAKLAMLRAKSRTPDYDFY